MAVFPNKILSYSEASVQRRQMVEQPIAEGPKTVAVSANFANIRGDA